MGHGGGSLRLVLAGPAGVVGGDEEHEQRENDQ